MTRQPQFLVLTTDDCTALLKRNHVGRLAFVHDASVDIEPITYVFDGRWVFMRSAYGTKLEALARNPFVAFEVDEVRGPFDWRSVVVHGTIYMLPQDGAPIEQQEFERALDALRSIMPDALTKDDPTPARTVVYGLHVDRMTGRMAGNDTPRRGRAAQPVRGAPKQRRPRDAF